MNPIEGHYCSIRGREHFEPCVCSCGWCDSGRTNNWKNEVFDNEEKYQTEQKNDTMEEYYEKGCKVCGALNGIHGFSFDRKNTPKGG